MAELIVGGSSGLGLELAKAFASEGNEVIVTGRHDPHLPGIQYEQFELSSTNLPKRIGRFVSNLPEVNVFVYAAGYYQEGRITDLSDEQIETMIDVGERAFMYFTRELLKCQKKLGELIAITSTSQWTPRQKEPVYNMVKAGEGHFANAMAEDGRVGKVLVAGPAGMDTPFWRDDPGRDKAGMLDPQWVAQQIMDQRSQTNQYRYVRILRQPPRVEVVESR